jgi:type I restriction enzyme S subunit
MKMVELRDVAPPLASDRSLRTGEKVWLLNLDQIEAQTGRILSKVYSDTSNVGSSTQPFDNGNVLFSKLRPYLNKVVLPDESGVATTELVPLRPDPKRLERSYLAYYLRSPSFVAWATNEVAGAKMPRLVMQSFWKQQIPLPPLAEQKRIAAILDKADAIRRKLQQSLRLCDEFLRSVFLDMFGDPVTNPKGWPFVQIGDLLESTSYGTSKKASETTGAFPCLRMNNITYSGGWDFTSLKYVDLDSKEQKNNLVHSGQLLFNRTNSKELVGKTAVYRRKDPMAFAGYLVRGIANSQADTEYISAYLNLPHGKAVLQSMCKNIIGMANINAEEFKSIRIQNPPVAMQKRFAAIVHSTELKKETLHKFLSESESLFSSLQQRAFRGEL